MQSLKNELTDIVKLSVTVGLASTSSVFLGNLLLYDRNNVWQNHAALGLLGCSIGAWWFTKRH